MHGTIGRKWLEGAFPDPAERYRCCIFDAIGALALPELLGGGAALGVDAAATALPALAADAAITLPEVVATAAAPAAFDIGATALPAALGAGALGAGAAGALDTGGAVGDALSTFPSSTIDFGGVPGLTTGTGAGTGALVPTGAASLTTGAPAALAAPTAGVGSAALPSAAAGAVPASVAPDITATGSLAETIGGSASPTAADIGGDFGGGSGTATAGGSSGSGLTSGLDKLVSGATGGALNTKDLGLITSLGGLGMNLLNRNQPIPGEKNINQAASSLSATAAAQANQGFQLESFLHSGTLPPGLSEGLKTATNAAVASIKSGYANRGIAPGSSAEAQDIQAATDRAQTAAAEMALQLLQQGSSMVGQAANTESLAAQLYQSIMATSLQQDQQLGSAIGRFASALAGSGSGSPGTITLKAA